MEFLTKNQKRLLMTGDGKLESNWDGGFISAEGKDVIVIGVSFALPRIVVLFSSCSLSLGQLVSTECTIENRYREIIAEVLTSRCCV